MLTRLGLSLAILFTGSAQAETITVGLGGDFATINEALAEASSHRPRYVQGGETVEVRLLSGFRMEEQVIVEQVDLGFVKITSADREVRIVRSELTTQVYSEVYPAFTAFRNAVLPVIAVLFDMDTSGPAVNRTCFFISHDSRADFEVGSGCKHAGGRGLEVHNGSVVQARETIWTDAGEIGMRVANGAWVGARGSDVSGAPTCLAIDGGSHVAGHGMALDNCTGIAASVNHASSANFYKARMSNAGSRALSVRYASRVDASYASIMNAGKDAVYAEGSTVDVQRSNLSGAGGTSVLATQGSQVNASSVTANGSGTGVLSASGSSISAREGNFCGARVNGCFAIDGSRIDLHSAKCQKGATPSAADIVIKRGSFINATGAKGGLSHTRNVLVPQGIIFQ
ncbi:MAG TPA: hypothetical protein VLQ45_31955 [Thermoanaerobaculia bacterium]|nr:hypothetical protein [Thermoanaerobaculia bacterium]